MFMKCKRCKYFQMDPKENYPEYMKNFGKCTNPIFFVDNSDWTNPKLIEECRSNFKVHENFGCVGFEEK